MQTQTIHVRTVEAGHGFEDFRPLTGLIGDARIVALGKATHGTREFFQLKHRLVEFLVAELRFSVFAIEANWPECEEINDYVVTDRSNPASFEFGVPLQSCSDPDPGFGMID